MINHDDEKIAEILERYDIIDQDSYRAMKEYGDYIRTQTLEEAKGCIPKEQSEEDIIIPEGVSIGEYRHCEILRIEGRNECREQTLTNLNLLDK